MKLSKSIITGGAGFIGSNLTDHLVRIGHKVIILDNFVSGKKSNLAHHKKKDVKIIKINISKSKNLDKNLTEYYDLIYQYKNDCLTASVEYKKTFYNDVDIDPNENIFFTISIVPFGSINSPVIY